MWANMSLPICRPYQYVAPSRLFGIVSGSGVGELGFELLDLLWGEVLDKLVEVGLGGGGELAECVVWG